MIKFNMSLTLTLKECIELVGLDPNQNTGGDRFTSATNLLKNKSINQAIAKNITDGWAKNQLSPLFLNVNHKETIEDLRRAFTTFLGQAEDKPLFNLADNPQLQNASFNNKKFDAETDPLLQLFVTLKQLLKGEGSSATTNTNAAATFLFNSNQYKIEFPDETISSLDEVALDALSVAGSNFAENLIVPQSAVMMSGSSDNLKNFVNQPYPTFTGIDLEVVFLTPHITSKNVTIKTLTYSMHSGLTPISTLGRSATKGFAKGKRTIAGTMIATITQNDPLMELQPVLYTSNNKYAQSSSDVWRTYMLPDQFPIFDILCVFNNEYGFSAVMPIFGVKITDVGQVTSMSDSEIEISYTYIAQDIDVLRTVSYVTEADGTIRTIDILSSNEYLAKRERALKGESEHKGTKEVASLFAALDRRSEEIAYQRLRAKGASLGDVIKIKEIVEKK